MTLILISAKHEVPRHCRRRAAAALPSALCPLPSARCPLPAARCLLPLCAASANVRRREREYRCDRACHACHWTMREGTYAGI